MKLNVKQFRRELTQVIAVAKKEIQERQEGIAKAKRTLEMLNSFEGNIKSTTKKVTKMVARPEGAIGITEAITRVLDPNKGMLMRDIITNTLAHKPHTNSVDPASAITATVAGLLARNKVRRKQTKEGYLYFSKPAKAAKPAQAAA